MLCLMFLLDCIRDLAVANITEKMKKLERNLRNSNTEYDKAMADLHVCTLQSMGHHRTFLTSFERTAFTVNFGKHLCF